MARIRLLYCIDTVGQNAGPDKQLAEIIRRIDCGRFEVHLCVLQDSDRLHELAERCHTLVLPMRRLWSLHGLRQIFRLRRYINEHKIDVIHTFLNKANILAILAAWCSRCPVVISSRRNLGYWLTPFYLWLYRRLDRITTRLLANSERVKRFAIETEGVPPEQVDVLYNGVDMEQYAPGAGDPSVPAALGIPADAKVVGIVANLRPVKDHALFLRAAKQVTDAVPEATFLLVGRGPLRGELGRQAEQLGIAGRVFFTDGAGAVADHLARMSVACLSSESEGFSNAVLEYMAAGLPVVATDAGGNAEAVEHGVNGFIVPHGAPDALAEPIIELLRDDAKREDMGRRASERCRDRFEIAAAVRRHEEYYASLHDLRHHASHRIPMRNALKAVLNILFIVLISPAGLLAGFGRIGLLFHVFTHLFSLAPGKPGEYVRRAFYWMTLDRFSLRATTTFGTFFSSPHAIVEDGVYIGAYSIIGQAHIRRGCQIASNVHILSGPYQHRRDSDGNLLGTARGSRDVIEIGANCWIGASVVVMADIGERSTIGAGAVVNRPVPAGVLAVGVPAQVVRSIESESASPGES
jgi:glycosyltransferase involved in cell wall biosynthesis/acetyltransferase-like isoleucine patch superfamily enzyme